MEQNSGNFFPHGNIRAANVFVAEHTDLTRGFDLAVNGMREEAAVAEVVDDLRGLGGEVTGAGAR